MDPEGRVAWLRTLVVGPDLQPDYLDQGIPPFCMAFRWPADGVPNINAADAGKITIEGHGAPKHFTWGVQPPPTPEDTPSTISCARGPIPDTSLHAYQCSIDPVVGLVGSMIEDETELSIAAAGGEHIGAFSETGLKAPRAVTPAGTFDLNQVDLSNGVVAQWLAEDADTVLIELFAQLIDGATPGRPPSEFAQVLCLEPAKNGRKELPAGALSVLPQPSGAQALMIQTSLVGTQLRQSAAGWGSSMVGAGRGTFGITCRTANGDLCPPPQASAGSGDGSS